MAGERVGKKIIAIAVLVVTMCVPQPAHAQPLPSLAASPAMSEWLAAPGEKQQKLLQITNESAQPLPIKAVAKSMVLQEVIDDKDQHLFDASSWFSIDEPNFILRAGETRRVAVTLSVPRGAEAGGHYASIDFEQLSLQGPSSEGQTRTASRISTLAFIIVKGNIDKRLRLDGGVKTVHEDGHLRMEVKLQNTGNVHVMPVGNIVITDIFGHKVSVLPLPTAVILPHTSRALQLVWNKAPRFGYYTATVEVAYGEQHTTMREARGFWLLPWSPLVPLVLLVPIIVWGLYRARSRFAKAWAALWKD